MYKSKIDTYIRYILGSNSCNVNRNGKIDSIKSVLIILMVLGHVLNYSLYGLNQGFHNFIYSFHMPLFIFISGIYSKTSEISKLKRQVFFLLLTTIVFQFLYLRNLNLENWIRPYWILWYIFSLAIWKLILFLFYRHIRIKQALITSFCIGLSAGFLPVGYDFSLSRILVFLPFIVLGFFISTEELFEKIKKIKYYWAILLLISLGLIFIFYRNLEILPLLKGSFNYYDLKLVSVSEGFILRLIYYVISILISCCIIRLTPLLPLYFRKIGQNSLFIYLFHGFFVAYLGERGFFSLYPNVIFASLCTFIIVFIIEFIRMNILNIYNFLYRNICNED